jgi:4-hydroxy-tetrahydrodipicolinate reductase
MGREVCRAVHEADDLELVAAVDPLHVGIDLSQLGIDGSHLTVASDPQALLDARVEVAVDFTVLDAARRNVGWCAANGVHAVVGTTGFSNDELGEFARTFADSDANAIIAPNFTIGAVLMMRFAEMAAPYFDTGEIVELHHDRKIDAPSGTAMMTARRMGAASSAWSPDPTEKEVAMGARGGTVSGIPVHSIRMRGMFAHQEVILGVAGQTLSIRHDSFDRSAYMPGVLLAVREVHRRPGLTLGLDALLGL